MNLSKHFARSEFACHCGCGFDVVDYELLTVLERVRERFDKPVVVTSGARCRAHNAAVGGSKSSQHIKGKAADVQVEGVDPIDVYDFLNAYAPEKYGLGLYQSWVHIDSRAKKARWNLA